VTKDQFRRWHSVLEDNSGWEGVGALVGYPERFLEQTNLEPKPEPIDRHSSYDASRSPTSTYLGPKPEINHRYSQYDAGRSPTGKYDHDHHERERSTTTSSRYVSASPTPNGSSRGDSMYSDGRSDFGGLEYGSASERSSSTVPDRYEQRVDRGYSPNGSVKQETYYDEYNRDRSGTPLFLPKSRSPSRHPMSPTSSSRYSSTAPSITPLKGELEDHKFTGSITPLKPEYIPDVKPFGVKDEDEKKPLDAGLGYAGAPRRTFALDTQVFYATAGRTWAERYPLYKVTENMGLSEKDAGICAGNELRDIWDIASRLLSGPPVLFVKGRIEEDVRIKKLEDEYYKLEENGHPGPGGSNSSSAPQGGAFGAPPPVKDPYASKPKRDFYEAALEDDEDW